MGKYINIGLTDFQSVRKDEYVDKSMLIAYVNSVLGTQRKFLCVTRARRFGKSIAAKMLCAYYDKSVDARSLFADLKIAKDPSFETHLNQYPVIYLDVTRFTSKVSMPIEEVVVEIDEALKDEVRRMYGEVEFDAKDDLQDMLRNVVEKTGKQFIMIIDEWDAICRESNNDEVMRQYVNWLRGLFKAGAADRVFAGVYMTGILPIKQYNTQSALNNFQEFSMIKPGPLAGYFGFTKDEVHALAKQYKMDEEEIRQWYDGYQLGGVTEIYNPYSVMCAVQRSSIESYWTSTGAYEGLLQYITMNFDGLRDAVLQLLVGDAVRVNVLGFSNDMHVVNNRNAVLTLLIHLGYLSYDKQSSTVRIPNYEVRAEFEQAIQDTNWNYVAAAIQNSDQLVRDTLDGKTEAVEKAIELVHQDKTSILQYNDENALAYVVSLAYVAACKDYTSVREFPSGKGFADIVFIPRRNVDKPAIVVELKHNHSAESGLEQIKRKQYAESLKEYVGDVVLVGISYDEKTKKHSCIIERTDGALLSSEKRGKDASKRGKDEPKRGKDGVSKGVVKLLMVIEDKSLTVKEMMALLNLRGDDSFRKRYLKPALEGEYIAMHHPDTPTSGNQAYYMTEKGKQLLSK